MSLSLALMAVPPLLSTLAGHASQRSFHGSRPTSRRRGPTRLFGLTKSQVLDFFMRSNARLCATITLGFLPASAYWLYRYYAVAKPSHLEHQRQQEEALLSEGQALPAVKP